MALISSSLNVASGPPTSKRCLGGTVLTKSTKGLPENIQHIPKEWKNLSWGSKIKDEI
jgi:hypothetical protein